MRIEHRIRQLVEAALDSDRTPDEVCRDCPELLGEVRKQWEQVRAVEAEMEALFPRPDDPPADDAAFRDEETGLPRIEGYDVEAVLGRGGMGVVYRARHRKLNRPVALKMILAGAYASPRDRARFEREAEAVAALRHPNVVQVYDSGEAGGRPYFTMEFVEGGTLAQKIAGTPQPAHEAAALVARVAEAMQVAHQRGIVHRDLKPANILLTADGTPKVTDFGLARRLQDESGLTLSGRPVGTPSYMAPEQVLAQTDAIGPATDVYALGAVLYHMLTGRPPFQAESATATLQQVLTEEPVPPTRLTSRVPRDLQTICLKCLNKDPRRRYPSAAELAADLGRFLRQEPILARPVGPLERVARWSRRNPTGAALAGALFVTALAALAAIFCRWREAEAFARAESAANIRLEAQRQEAVAAKHRAEQAGAMERWERYRSDIAAAAAAMRLQITSTAQRALDEAPEEHRNWEWDHLHSQLDSARAALPGAVPASENFVAWRLPIVSPSGKQLATLDADRRSIRLWDTTTGGACGVLRRSDSPVRALAYSPDGKRLAFSCGDGSICLCDPTTATEVAIWRGHEKPVELLLYSPDGRRLVSQADDGHRLWDTATGQILAHFPGRRGSCSALFTADGRRLILAREPEVGLWDAGTGRQIAVVGNHRQPVIQLAISPDGRLIASHGDREKFVCLWDGMTGQEIASLHGHTAAPTCLVFSPDGSRLASGSPYPDNTVRLWEAASGRPLAVLHGHTNMIWSVAFSSDGRRLVSTSMDGTARLWDGVTGQPGAVLRGHTEGLSNAIFSPEGSRVVTCSEDRTLRLWDAGTGDLVTILRGHKSGVRGAHFIRGTSLLVSLANDGEARVWDLELAERNGILRGHHGFVYDVAFSPDGTQVASSAWDGTVRIWDATTERQTARLRHEGGKEEDQIVSSVAWHPSGRQLASVTRNDTITVWEVGTGKAGRVLRAPTGSWTGDARAVFDHAGTLLAAGSRDGSVRLWETAAGRLAGILQGHEGPVLDLAFSPDGTRLASVGFDGTVRLWDVATHKAVAALPGDKYGYRVAYSADGRLLAACSMRGQVRLWDAATHQELAVLPYGSGVLGLAFSPDGSRLATGCSDSTIHLWDVASRRDVCELRGHSAYVHAVAFSSDGTRLASASGDHTLRVWDALPVSVRARLRR
jgi:WD40 repeat protein/tRNA A-37 threonylcarbamoyl transferase component Bud32